MALAAPGTVKAASVASGSSGARTSSTPNFSASASWAWFLDENNSELLHVNKLFIPLQFTIRHDPVVNKAAICVQSRTISSLVPLNAENINHIHTYTPFPTISEQMSTPNTTGHHTYDPDAGLLQNNSGVVETHGSYPTATGLNFSMTVNAQYNSIYATQSVYENNIRPDLFETSLTQIGSEDIIAYINSDGSLDRLGSSTLVTWVRPEYENYGTITPAAYITTLTGWLPDGSYAHNLSVSSTNNSNPTSIAGVLAQDSSNRRITFDVLNNIVSSTNIPSSYPSSYPLSTYDSNGLLLQGIQL